jgi:hypothetical protein
MGCCLLVMRITVHFSRWKLICHCDSHRSSDVRSCWSVMASLVVLIFLHTRQSSANSPASEDMDMSRPTIQGFQDCSLWNPRHEVKWLWLISFQHYRLSTIVGETLNPLEGLASRAIMVQLMEQSLVEHFDYYQ